MHLLFLDESGQLAERRFFALGGIALRDADWPELRDAWYGALTSAGCCRGSPPTRARARWRASA